MRRVGGAMLAAISSLAAAVPPPRDYIHAEVASWGMPIGEWTIAADGNGQLRELARPQALRDRTMTLRRIAVGPAGYRRIVALLAPAERAARGRYRCQPVLTEQIYGTLRFVRGSAFGLSFDYGCESAVDRAVLGAITAAGSQMRAWAAGAPAAILHPRRPAMLPNQRHEPQ